MGTCDCLIATAGLQTFATFTEIGQGISGRSTVVVPEFFAGSSWGEPWPQNGLTFLLRLNLIWIKPDQPNSKARNVGLTFHPNQLEPTISPKNVNVNIYASERLRFCWTPFRGLAALDAASPASPSPSPSPTCSFPFCILESLSSSAKCVKPLFSASFLCGHQRHIRRWCWKDVWRNKSVPRISELSTMKNTNVSDHQLRLLT